MARPGPIICGTIDDLSKPDYRSYLPPFCILPGFAVAPTFTRSHEDTRLLAWVVRQLDCTYNITLPSGTVIANSFSFNPCNVLLSGDEGQLPCATRLGAAYNDSTGNWAQFGCPVVLWDSTSTDFTYQPRFDATGISNETTGFAVPTLSSVTATVLGNSIPIYVELGDTATGTLTIAIAATNGYWAWDDLLGIFPPHGPVWDANAGTQLQTPTPS